MPERLKKLYKETIVPNLLKKLGYKNAHQIPRLSKIVINRGLGTQNSKSLEASLNELTLITGQVRFVPS